MRPPRLNPVGKNTLHSCAQCKGYRLIPNPWHELPLSGPYVLQRDAQAIGDFNRTARDHHRVHLEILPEPFLGNPLADIVLLSLNPGFSIEEERFHHFDADFRGGALANLSHTPIPYPFYFLEPGKASPGHMWWQQRLKSLTDLYGHRAVANNVLCLEYFPYHSERFHSSMPRVPSQVYTRHLLEMAMKREAVVIVMRSLDRWRAAVPALDDYVVHTLKSSQAVYVSPRNCPTGFGAACERLNASK